MVGLPGLGVGKAEGLIDGADEGLGDDIADGDDVTIDTDGAIVDVDVVGTTEGAPVVVGWPGVGVGIPVTDDGLMVMAADGDSDGETLMVADGD